MKKDRANPDGKIEHPGRIDRAGLERIAELFRVFSEPTRLGILQELRNEPRAVGELVDALGLSQANISQHLKTLYDAGLLKREKDGTRALYSLDDPFANSLCALACEKLNQDARKAAELKVNL